MTNELIVDLLLASMSMYGQDRGTCWDIQARGGMAAKEQLKQVVTKQVWTCCGSPNVTPRRDHCTSAASAAQRPEASDSSLGAGRSAASRAA